uniref:Phosphatidylinositol-3-phosphatase SAC1 n=2 Tax=Schistocephalus solidus TaxID=70667 RepID=A0A0X3NW42_SCHSO
MVPDTTYEFYNEADQYVIYLRKNGEYQRPLVINRITQEITPANYERPYSDNVSSKPSTIYGILGTIRLLSGRYLITVDKRGLAGQICGHKIYRALEISVHRFAKSTSDLNEEEMETETAYIKMLKRVLGIESFYFSHTYDLSLSRQRLSGLSPDVKQQNLFGMTERRFVWNGFLLDDWCNLVSAVLNVDPIYAWPKLEDFVTPVILGFVGILQPLTPISSSFGASEDTPCYALISRRSFFCAGTCSYARETDKVANAATAVETEQIAYIPPGHIFSFVQILDPAPVICSKQPNLFYKTPMKIDYDGKDSANGTDVQSDKEGDKNELFGQIQVAPEEVETIKSDILGVCSAQQYGRTIIINLLDEKSLQMRLCRSYVDEADLRNQSVDFNRECSAHQWHRLSSLLDRLEPEIVAMRQLRLRSVGPNLTISVLQDSQTGVFRTNCLDCADRANVLQSMIARRALELGLQEAYLVSAVSRGKSDFMGTIWPKFEQAFTDIWAENAYVLSFQLSDTKAFKTDSIHMGKRTATGVLMENSHSADCYLQDSINLFLGHYSVFDSDGSPKKRIPANAPVPALRPELLP